MLEADLVYKRKGALGGKGKMELVGQTAGSVNFDRNQWEGDEVEGDDLFLGVKVRLKNCFKLAKNGRGLADANF